MRTSYGVLWRNGGQPPMIGTLEFRSRRLRLEPSGEPRAPALDVAYEDLSGVRVATDPDDRIDGRSTLILERRSAKPVHLASAAQPVVVAEIAERLAAIRLGGESTRRTVVIVPLQEGAHDAVRALLDSGPPFDPFDTGLDR